MVSRVLAPEAGAGTGQCGWGTLGLRSVSVLAVFSASHQLPSAPQLRKEALLIAFDSGRGPGRGGWGEG